MNILKFKTNINCGNCVKAVTPILNNDKEIKSWAVDTDSPDKVLTVQSERLSSSEVINLIWNAGFKGEVL